MYQYELADPVYGLAITEVCKDGNPFVKLGRI